MVCVSHYRRNGDSGVWSLVLTNLIDNNAVWSAAIPVSPQRPMDAVRTAADELDLFGREVRMVQLHDVEALIDAGDLQRAATLYRRYLETHAVTQESTELGSRIDELQAEEHYTRAQRFTELWLFDEALIEINRAIGARTNYRRAMSYYWAGDYAKARADLSEAIGYAPDRPEYARLMEQIDRASQDRRTTDLVWQEYRNQFAALDLRRMASGPVRVPPTWEGGIGTGTYRYRDTDTLDQTETRQIIATGALRRPYLIPIGLETPFFSLYGGWHGGASIRVGSNEVDDSTHAGDGTRRLSRRTIWTIGPVGGGFLQARLFGFSLSSGLEVDNHLLIVARLERDPAQDHDRYTTNVAWVPELNWFADLSWHWNDHERLTVRYTTGLASKAIPEFDTDTERYRSTGLTISYGRRWWW